ncbi:hypothetical protein EST38_g4922 [Candolleomyces aberdarensis]|uniref:Fungal-type protein kinase domain-containing protein n=1 Tax=Candolleomyces aberdarensis TaxID=2316362 RepID=A0A4Q2DNL8_9AGAR|nr:hypothetical protein EST38_g4922 [Candolleomyces aberdarensis]
MRTRSSEKKKARVSLDPTFDEQRRLVLPELGEAIRLDDDTFIRSLYHHVAPQLAIDTFLKKSRFYSLTQRRWKLPRNCCKLLNDDFHTPFFDVFSSILKHFWRDPTAHGTREVVDTHTSDLQHREADSIIHHSRPSLVIKAKGPSFQLPYAKPGEKQSKVGYSNISACIDIQIDGNALSISDQLVRATIYARQIFIHQPNRRFVRVLLLTEQHVRLFHFDRSGAQYTPLLDFHDNPHTFVRLVLGLSSPRETDVGLDDSIQWTTQDGRKVSGTLRTCGTNNEDIIYQLAAIQPFFFNDSIRGRSTICWSVRDPITDEELVVKDSWRSEDRLSEHIFLQDAVGVPGVVQMVTCEPDRCETKSLREFGDVLPAGFRNRIETRIVMKTYGKSVCRYTSPKQLFCALRDAIAGHMELFKKGKPGAESGYRGVLIDFDISILRSLNKPADWRMGTRLYQSVPVLYSATVPHPLPHDHLDDLESFLYILVHIMFTCDSNGAAHAANEMLSRWDKFGDDPYSVATFKESYLTRKIVPRDIQQRWPSPCVDLILAFAAFIRPLVQDKLALDYMEPTVRNGGETVFAVGATQHYSHILHLFDTAIEALDRPDTWRVLVPFPDDKKDCSSKAPPSSHPASRPDIQPAANPPKNPARSSLKRASDDYPDDQPAAKRSNSPQSSRSSFVPLPRHSHEGSVPSPT